MSIFSDTIPEEDCELVVFIIDAKSNNFEALSEMLYFAQKHKLKLCTGSSDPRKGRTVWIAQGLLSSPAHTDLERWNRHWERIDEEDIGVTVERR